MGATASLALSTASTVSQASAQRRAASGAEAQGDYQADIYDRNAGLADRQSADALLRGSEAEQRHRVAARGFAGAQRAGLAAQGIDVNSGSALDAQADTAQLSEMDALTIRNNAAREAWGYSADATNARNSAALARASGKNAAQSLRDQSFSTLLTGAAGVYGQSQRTPPSFNAFSVTPRTRGWGG